jgi:hypothetical protein
VIHLDGVERTNNVWKNIGIPEFRCVIDENDLMSNPLKIPNHVAI